MAVTNQSELSLQQLLDDYSNMATSYFLQYGGMVPCIYGIKPDGKRIPFELDFNNDHILFNTLNTASILFIANDVKQYVCMFTSRFRPKADNNGSLLATTYHKNLLFIIAISQTELIYKTFEILSKGVVPLQEVDYNLDIKSLFGNQICSLLPLPNQYSETQERAREIIKENRERFDSHTVQ